MSLSKFKTKSYCVGGRHYTGTANISGQRTPSGKPYLQGNCTTCKRNKTMFVTESQIEAEGLGDFFRAVGKKLKPIAKNVIGNLPRAIELVSQLGVAGAQAYASKNPSHLAKPVSDTARFLKTGRGVKSKGLYLPRK